MVNRTVLQGRLVDVPTFGSTTGGTDYANFRIAWSEKYKDKETKLFIDCKAFGGTATFMKNFMNQKGQEILAEGKLNTEEWEKDGQKRSKIALIVNGVHFCGKRQEGNAQDDGVAVNMTPVEVPTDELPFDRGLAYP